jgi:hypothetical protein
MSPLLSSLLQMGGWATGPTAFKASSQEQKRKLLFFEAYTVLDNFFVPFTPGYPSAFLSEYSRVPGVPHFLIFRQVCQHTMLFSKYLRYLRVFFPQSRP